MLEFKPIFWEEEEVEGDETPSELRIHVSGLTKEQKTVYGIITGFRPSVYVELPPLPSGLAWDPQKVECLFNFFRKKQAPNGPISFRPVLVNVLHFNRRIKAVKFEMPSHAACRSLSYRCTGAWGLTIPELGRFEGGSFVVHESDVDPIIKFTATKKIDLSGWVKVDLSQSNDEGFSTCDIDFEVDMKDIFPSSSNAQVFPTYLSFDLECYSRNHNSKNPDPSPLENAVFNIGVVYGRVGDSREERKKYNLTLFDPLDVPDTEMRRFKSEKELIEGFADIIKELDPDIFYGYNILKFDWEYLIKRAELGSKPKSEGGLGWGYDFKDKFLSFSRIHGDTVQIKEIRWSSSAYGVQVFKYPAARGRVNFDVFSTVEKGYTKFASYKLNHVANYYLGESKDPITPRQLFMIYHINQKMEKEVMSVRDGVLPKDQRVRLKTKILKLLPRRHCSGPVLAARKALKTFESGKQLKERFRKLMYLVAKYCMQDTILPIDIANKLNIYVADSEMSNITGVPISYLSTRGQQIKVLAQVYRNIVDTGVVITHKKKLNDEDIEKVQGAMVQDGKKGFHRNVATGDFNSLYPSIIIALNLCWTTLVPPHLQDLVKDEDCNILHLHEHSGCPHDPKKRKKKEEEIICRDPIYKFYKVKTFPDGTRTGEGILPRICRGLLAERKSVKVDMAKAQALYDTATGKATEKEIAEYTKRGWKIATPGSLSDKELRELKINITVLDARQNALKISANSAYGTLGAQRGHLPLVPGASTVTATGRELITSTIEYILKENPGDENGKGKAILVYGDTDSCMIKYDGLNTVESFRKGDEMTAKATVYLRCKLLKIPEDWSKPVPTPDGTQTFYSIDKYPRKPEAIALLSDEDKVHIYEYDACPINLAMENLYQIMFLLTMKRYLTRIVNREGKVTSDSKKGVVTVRRDNCKFLKDTFTAVQKAIFDEKSKEETINILVDQIDKLFRRQIPDANLIIYVGVKDVIEYAAKKTKKNKIVVKTQYFDADGNEFERPESPLDPRLVYRNSPQALLALKMIRRGDDVPPNTRLEYLYIENPNAVHQGEKAEDYTYYRDNRIEQKLRPDYLHYIEKQIVKPLLELITVRWEPEIQPYEPLEQKIMRLSKSLNELESQRLACTNSIEKRDSFSKGRELPPKTIMRTFKDFDAKVEYIIQSAKKFDPAVPNSGINPEKHSELVGCCKVWKSNKIITKLYRKHNLTPRKEFRPFRHGDSLPLGTKKNGPTKVYVMTPITDDSKMKQPIGTIASLLEKHEEPVPGHKTAKKYFYDLMFTNENTLGMYKETIATKVPREYFTPFVLKGTKLLNNIYLARFYYRQVVDQIAETKPKV